MENLNLSDHDLKIFRLGAAEIDSPLGLSTSQDDLIADYLDDEASVVLFYDRNVISEFLKKNHRLPAFIQAGPRKKIFFTPSRTAAAIVTCGGLCPGINNVIRSLVMELYYRYGVENIWGVQYGYSGFNPRSDKKPIRLTPDVVKGIHENGGSFLGSSRGPQDVGEIVDFLTDKKIDILFTIGGDGTLRGAEEVYKEIDKRGLKKAVVAVPKTIDNDIAYVEKTFGFETAFSVAAEAIRSAHTEAIGAPNGIGIVKVMGRYSGFIAANAAMAINEVNFVLIPEVPFELQGAKGLFALLKKRLQEKHHAVIIVAEGAGQELLPHDAQCKDRSGNIRLKDIGLYLKEEIEAFFSKQGMEVNLKYIDPSYLIRAVPANAHDAIYCMQLAQNAVHAGMAGYTGIVIGRWNDKFTMVPIRLAVSERKYINPESQFWLTVIEATGQPFKMINSQREDGQ
jgi:6-phosphofructokinase 1